MDENKGLPKYKFNAKTGIAYELIGDYYYPKLNLPEEKALPLGIYAQRHKEWLKENNPALYGELLILGGMNEYLYDVEQRATEMAERLTKQLQERQGVTEELKARDQMEWVGAMNNIQNQVREIVNQEVIYAN